ncbi:MAG TPA: hypothetical protein DCZ01_05735 [Elusimicrobia bacterium]|nr:MAG: hypothetical protein A2X37_11290 [Elusimicrobia bacterium GWA2_66_18]HAZ08021.1 hypothetical protein [Elusimicrobiota bacterium]
MNFTEPPEPPADQLGATTRIPWILLILSLLSLTGCMATWTGHRVPIEKLSSFKPGETTAEQVEQTLGKPENIVHKSMDGLTVYIYQSIVNVVLGVPLPISVGRGRQRGFMLNVVFRDGVYRGFELTQLNQTLLWR